MCSTQLKCSVCNESTATNRIIVETCGHQKCRGCFIREEDGCSICITANASHVNEEDQNAIASLQAEDLSANIAANIDQDKQVTVIENVLISTKTSYKGKSTHGIRKNRPAHITVMKDDGGKVITYTCTICKKCFRSRNNQSYHFYCDKSQSKPFKCRRCGKQFITQSHLQYHEQSHDNNVFPCNVCDRVFSTEIGLRRHARKHTNERKYECKMCDQRFLYKEQLNAHENRHNNTYHKCTECSMQFLMKSNLTKHMLAHAGKNQEPCPICRKTYSGKSALKVHMLTHSNQRRFQCDLCEKSFVDQRTLVRHTHTHSSNLYYECSLCEAKTTRKDNIRRHVRNIHAETVDDVETILNEICRNHAERNKQTDKSSSKVKRKEKTEKITKKLVVPTTTTVIERCHRDDGQQIKNAPMSVIKFVGKSTAPIDLVTDKSSCVVNLLPTKNNDPKRDPCSAQDRSNTEPETMSDWNTFECGVEMPTYQPLTLDPIPQMEPLPLLTTHNNSNLSVYRQLLSPYLRRTN